MQLFVFFLILKMCGVLVFTPHKSCRKMQHHGEHQNRTFGDYCIAGEETINQGSSTGRPQSDEDATKYLKNIVDD